MKETVCITRYLPAVYSTHILTLEEWRAYIEDNDPTTYIQGYLYNVKVRSVGGNMLEAYLEATLWQKF